MENKTLFYLDKAGCYHSFQMKLETLEGILKEFKNVGDYLRSLGTSFKVCGIKDK